MILLICTRDAINGAGSYNYEQGELTVLCEEALQKCRASITVCMSDGKVERMQGLILVIRCLGVSHTSRS